MTATHRRDPLPQTPNSPRIATLFVPSIALEASWRRVAASVLRRSLGLHRGQTVVLDTSAHTLPVVEVFASEARRLGIRPSVMLATRSIFDPRSSATPADQTAISPSEVASIKACDGYVFFPPSIEDRDRQDELTNEYRRALAGRQREWSQLLQRESVPSVYLLGGDATVTSARRFDVDPKTWFRESLRASLVNPARMRKSSAHVARSLTRGRRILIQHPNGTHLELGLAGRPPTVDDGMVSRQDLLDGRFGTTVPGGFLAIPLDERIAEGHFVSNRPARFRHGSISGLVWSFRDGRLERYLVKRGRSRFEKEYASAGPEKTRAAVLVIGLNPEIHDFPLAEDLEQGLVTLLIGHNDDYGGRVSGSFRQFAMIRGADLLVDERPVLSGGRFVAPRPS